MISYICKNCRTLQMDSAQLRAHMMGVHYISEQKMKSSKIVDLLQTDPGNEMKFKSWSGVVTIMIH